MKLLDRFFRSIIRTGKLVVTDVDGVRHVYGDGGEPFSSIRLHDRKLYRDIVVKTELSVGEAYMDGTLTMEDGTHLRDMLAVYNKNRKALEGNAWLALLARGSRLFRRLQQSNRRGQAQRNVAHHYDIGNDFYKLFLDRNLLYSCAYFRNDNESLEQAQRNKLRLIAAKLAMEPGQKILDIGSGWGDMALYLAQLCEVEVTGVTLSREQCELANRRAQDMGLGDRVRFELRDYRELTGKFDRIVSIGMFEHVGVHHYPEFFSTINALMPDDGVMVLHSIGHMSPPGTASPWLRKYIFPGAYSPALSEVFPVVENERLWVLDLEFLRTHYAKTLNHWNRRFQSNRQKVVEMFDERFARMWEFYLISAEEMFRSGAQLVFHMQLSRQRDAVPLQRDYIFEKQAEYERLEAKLGMAA
ncbi:SAM-dependent methyltransferase [Salaquimonas pukyongi]|uniref:SAM-dependent methyltransferase n=1 Tax=Salaquimonas pukyongi TaxID=2712698 RepID=UPI00096B6CAC|nr:cyclopropane-fatty-acyl-phospholipid synthase family protein [Salaquimonas pukyongi]